MARKSLTSYALLSTFFAFMIFTQTFNVVTARGKQVDKASWIFNLHCPHDHHPCHAIMTHCMLVTARSTPDGMICNTNQLALDCGRPILLISGQYCIFACCSISCLCFCRAQAADSSTPRVFLIGQQDKWSRGRAEKTPWRWLEDLVCERALLSIYLSNWHIHCQCWRLLLRCGIYTRSAWQGGFHFLTVVFLI